MDGRMLLRAYGAPAGTTARRATYNPPESGARVFFCADRRREAACGRRIWMAGEREGENLNGSNEQRPNREETEIVAWSDESPERTAMAPCMVCADAQPQAQSTKGLRLVSAFASELGLGAASASY